MKGHDVLLVVVSVFVGPPVGTIVFCIVAAVVAAFSFGSRDAVVFIQYLPVALLAGYIFAALPAFIGSVIVAALSRRLPKYKSRLLLGSIVGLMAALPLAVLLSQYQRIGIAVSLCPAGAFAGLFCVALAEWMDPLPVLDETV